MGSSKNIAKGVFWTTFLNVVNGVYGFISVPILIAYFGKSDYGLIGLAISVNVYLRLMDMGVNSTNVRYFSNWLAKKEISNVGKLFQTSLAFYGGIGLLNGCILLGVSFFSDRIFNLDEGQDIILKHLFYILAISAFVSWLTSCFDQFIKAHEYVDWMAKVSLLPKFSQLLILGITVWFGLNIEWYYALTAFSMFIIIPIVIHKIKTIAPYVSFVPRFYKDIFKIILPYSLNIFSFGLFQFSLYNLRPVFLGIQGSMESVADYRILNGIISIVMMLGGAFMGVILPSASKVVALGDKDAQERIAYDGTKYISITLCFCCFGMMSVSSEVLQIYVGTEYMYLDIWLLIWLLITTLSHNQAISSLILSGSDIRAITYSSAVASVAGLVLCWYLIPYFGVGGTVIGMGAYNIIQILFYYLYYWPKKMDINSVRVFKSSFFPSVLTGGVAMLLTRFGLRQLFGVGSVWMDFLMEGIVFTLLYIGMIYVVVLNARDKNFFLKLVRKHA